MAYTADTTLYPTLDRLHEARPVAILRDGVVQAVVPTPDAVLVWMHARLPYSVSHALRHEGYTCRYATPTDTPTTPER